MKSSPPVIVTGAHPVPQAPLWSVGLGKRLASNVAWSTIAELLGRGPVLIGSLLIARALDVEVFGMLISAQALASCFWLAIDCGIGMYGVREVARHREQPQIVMDQLFSMRFWMGLACAPLFLLVVWLKCSTLEAVGVHLACGLSLVGVAFQPHWALRGLERFRLIAWGNFVSAAVFVAGAALLIRSPRAGITAGALWSLWFLLSAAAPLAALAWQGTPLRLRWEPSSWKRHLRASMYFATSGALVLIYNYAPVVLVENLSSVYQLGLFGPPFRIMVAIGALGFLIPSSFYPVLSQLYLVDLGRFHAARRRLHFTSLAAGLMVGGLLSVSCGPLVDVVLGSAYRPSASVLAILAWMAPCQFMRNAYRVQLMAAEKQGHVNVALLIGVLATVLGAALWIPDYGARGAAAALLCGEVSMLLVMIAAAPRDADDVRATPNF